MKPKNQRVFCYGTLKKGMYFHDKYLGGDKSEFLSKGITSPDYTMYLDGLPHLIKENTGLPCKGELYMVDEDVLKELDGLEGHPIVYFRDLIEVYNESGDRVLAWAYLRHPSFKGKKQAWPESEFV